MSRQDHKKVKFVKVSFSDLSPTEKRTVSIRKCRYKIGCFLIQSQYAGSVNFRYSLGPCLPVDRGMMKPYKL